jgi:hypothetical protein
MVPLAVGTAFLLGYALLAVPRFTPTDGPDWLFWMAIPAAGLAVVDSILLPKWGWLFGAVAGVVSLAIIHPIVPVAVSPVVCWGTAIAVAAVGAGLCLTARIAEPRVGTWAVMAGLCAAVGGASVVVLASDSASVGIRGLSAAAALAPLVLLTIKSNHGGRSVSIIAVTVLAGILTGGHFYAGVSWTQFAVLMFSPALLLAGLAVPGKHRRLAGLAAVLAVIVAIAPVVIPAVIAAKHAAESNDAYGAYGY